MMNRLLLGIFLCFFFITTALISCKRDDDEPLLPPTRISRLYVSFSDVQEDDLELPYNNIAVFDPADSVSLTDPVYFNSQVVEGGGILFSPFAKRVVQGSVRNSMIRTFSVSMSGVLGPASFFIDSTLTSQAGLAYDHVSTDLYVSNNFTNSIHVYSRGAQRSGTLKDGPNKRFELGAQPRGLVLDGDSLMIVTRNTANINELVLLENPSTLDSGAVSSSKKITVSGASDLRGVAYSHKLNLLVVSDVVTSKVYFIENVREAFTQNSTISGDASLNGTSTKIMNPIDIAIDDRDDKMFLYVADRAAGNKSILRFNLSDRGDVAPQTVFPLTLSPVSIYLDAR